MIMTDEILNNCLSDFKYISSPKEEQRLAVASLLEGKDVLAVLPTGFGNSFIYQYYFCAARKFNLAAGKERPLIFVISPLRSIIFDQVKDIEELDATGTSLPGENILEALESSQLDVVFGSAEQFLTPSFLEGLRKSDKIQQRLSLIVVDECHTVETWGKGKKKGRRRTDAFRSAFGDLASLRSFSAGVPVLAMTGTANDVMQKAIKQTLALKKNNCITIHLSPERRNIRYSVNKSSRLTEFNNLDWLVDSIKVNGIHQPKTIIFCSTLTDIANILGYLLSSLGQHAYASHLPKSASSRLIGMYHSMTLDKNKEKIYDAFKADKGVVRVIIASSALSMGVNFKDVRYVIHIGPSRSLVDHVQESGRAGRDGQLAHNVIIYHGQRLSLCEQAVKDFVKTTGCLRKDLFIFFNVEVESVTPGHNCCSNCAIICTCSGDSCSQPKFPFEEHKTKETMDAKVREVCSEDQEVLREALYEYRASLAKGTSSLFDKTICHGLSDKVISDILEHSHELFTLDDMLSNIPFFSVRQALSVLGFFHEIFEDIPSSKDVLSTLPETTDDPAAYIHAMNDIHNYFDESDSDIDADVLNMEELENL